MTRANEDGRRGKDAEGDRDAEDQTRHLRAHVLEDDAEAEDRSEMAA